MTPDIETGGYFNVLEIEAGEYSIGNVSVTGFALADRHANNPEMARFKVEAGRATYIGEVRFTVAKGCGSVTTEIKDEWARDARLFTARVTNIAASSVRTNLAK